MDCGLPPTHPLLRESAELFIERSVTRQKPFDEKWMLTRMDLCHLGFWLRIGGYFGIDEPRLAEIADVVLRQQMDDGGWNCRRRNYPQTSHGSFHTTFNVLEGLRENLECGMWNVESRPGEGQETSPRPSPWKGEGARGGPPPQEDEADRLTYSRASSLSRPGPHSPQTAELAARFREAEARAAEFMLCHGMYRSDKTGAVIDEKFTHLTFPSHWHYTVLRGLDYLRSTPWIVDSRLDDAVSMLVGRRGVNGRWPVEKRIAGTTHFDMEKMGGESRWNTLRMMRVLKAREEKSIIHR